MAFFDPVLFIAVYLLHPVCIGTRCSFFGCACNKPCKYPNQAVLNHEPWVILLPGI